MSNYNVDSPKELTHISLCAGYGGIDLGLQGAIRNLRTIAYSEIEAFACANLVAKMEAGSLDPAPIWTNLKTFPWEEFRGKVDIISGGFPCFEAGTLVLTRELGYVPIETVRVGDLVLTHTGRWRPVTAVMRKDGASTIEIRPTLGLSTRCTTEHPYYARPRGNIVERIRTDNVKGRRTKTRKRRHLGEPTWVDAAKLEPSAHRLGIVFPVEPEHSNATEDFWWLTGRYVADGWRQIQGTSGRVVIAANAIKMEECVRRAAAAGLGGGVVQDRTCQKLHITRTKFYEWCGQFGDGAPNKTVPGWVLGLQPNLLRAFVEGYLAGDGHREPSGVIAFTTVSERLVLGMALCVARATGKPFNLRKQRRTNTREIEGRTVNQRDWYRAIFADSHRRGVNDGSGVWSEFGRSPGTDGTTVYNIAVETDESYVANGVVVHNCQPFSHAGKRKGDTDERHLFPAIKRGIEICRPALVFLENVEGILSAKLAGDDWSDPAGTPVLLHVLRELERVGYRATAGLFSAAEVGAPHQRKRVFILAYDNSQRVEELRRQVAIEPGHDSSGNGGHAMYPSRPGEEMGDTQSGGRGVSGNEAQPRSSGYSYCSSQAEGLDNADNPGLSSRGSEPCEHGQGPALRGSIGNRLWPSRPGQPQHGWEPPRVVGDSRKDVADSRNRHGKDDAVPAGREGTVDAGSSGAVADTHRIDRSAQAEGWEHDRQAGSAGEELADTSHNESKIGESDDSVGKQRTQDGWREQFSSGIGAGGRTSRGASAPGDERHQTSAGNKRPYCGNQLGDTDHGRQSSGLNTGGCTETNRGRQGDVEQAESGHAQPPLGRDADGPAGGLDYAKLCVSCDNRTDELRLLGNGVVPATATKAFMVLSRQLLDDGS